MPQRTFEAEAEPILPDGFWPGETIEATNRSDLEQLMLDAATVLDRIGGTFSIVAIRREIGPGLFVPVGFRGKWESFAPAQRLPEPAPAPVETPEAAPEPEPDPEPELTADEAADQFPVDDFGPDAEEALAAAETS